MLLLLLHQLHLLLLPLQFCALSLGCFRLLHRTLSKHLLPLHKRRLSLLR